MYFGDRITVQTMVVHNDPSSRHDNKHFLVLYWTCSSQIQALLMQEALLLWVGHWVFLQSVASTLKCFSLQHICPKWSLIAHWRMHDIKCLQTWNNHVLSLLEIVCSGICIYHHVEQKLKFFVTHPKCVPLLFDHANCISVRESIYFIGASVSITVCFMETSCFPCTVEMHRKQRLSQSSAKESWRVSQSPYFHPSVRLSSGMNICGVAVFSHSRQFLYSFIKINFTWMSDLICCHKQFRL